MQKRTAEAHSSSNLAPILKLGQRALADAIAKPRRLVQDVGGNLVGWRADLGLRIVLARRLTMRDGEEQTAFPQGQNDRQHLRYRGLRPGRRVARSSSAGIDDGGWAAGRSSSGPDGRCSRMDCLTPPLPQRSSPHLPAPAQADRTS